MTYKLFIACIILTFIPFTAQAEPENNLIDADVIEQAIAEREQQKTLENTQYLNKVMKMYIGVVNKTIDQKKLTKAQKRDMAIVSQSLRGMPDNSTGEHCKGALNKRSKAAQDAVRYSGILEECMMESSATEACYKQYTDFKSAYTDYRRVAKKTKGDCR